MAAKNIKNRGIDVTLKELDSVRAKEIEYQEKEEKLKADLNAFIDGMLRKRALESVGSEEGLIRLVKGLDSGEIKMTFSNQNEVGFEDRASADGTEISYSDNNNVDKISEYGEG